MLCTSCSFILFCGKVSARFLLFFLLQTYYSYRLQVMLMIFIMLLGFIFCFLTSSHHVEITDSFETSVWHYLLGQIFTRKRSSFRNSFHTPAPIMHRAPSISMIICIKWAVEIVLLFDYKWSETIIWFNLWTTFHLPCSKNYFLKFWIL